MKRILVVSCSHGHHSDEESLQAVLAFKRDYKPDLIMHLGDFLDISAFMGGHVENGKGEPIEPDVERGIEFIRELEPRVVFLGNHEDRLYNLHQTGSEMVKFAAGVVIDKINQLCSEIKAELVPYSGTHDPNSWRQVGGTAYSHGYMYGEQCARDHAEMLGMPVVFGHCHKILQQPGRCLGAPMGISVGCLASIPAMHYAKNRRATAAWDNAYLWGEYDSTKSRLFVERIKSWQPPKIPVVE